MLADNINEDESMWTDDDGKENYSESIARSFGDIFKDCIDDGFETGGVIGGMIAGISDCRNVGGCNRRKDLRAVQGLV